MSNTVVILPPITGGDINPKVLSMCDTHIRKAKFTKDIEVKLQNVKDMELHGQQGHIITNPPYGKRLSDKDKLYELYSDFANAYLKKPGYSCHLITDYEKTQPIFGRKADRKRQLYNGNIKCMYYQFFGRLTK